MENEDVVKKGKLFVAGDRVGLRLDCNDGSLRFYRNGEPFGDQFLDWPVHQFIGDTFHVEGLFFRAS